LVFVLLAGLLSCANAAFGSQPDRNHQADGRERGEGPTELARMKGRISFVSGDPRPGDPLAPVDSFFLHRASGDEIELIFDPEHLAALGGERSVAGRMVEVVIEPVEKRAVESGSRAPAKVRSLHMLNDPSFSKFEKAVTGSQPWVSILCKFSDVSDEPKGLSYFQGMYASTYPGLDHYWRKLSYNGVNVSGSTAVAWVRLPHPVSHYESTSSAMLSEMAADCTAAADHLVYFPNFVGINLMFNDEFGPYAWGGSRYLSLDGTSKMYRVTWEPPWGYKNMGVIAHEMGHGFGLPHSNNADGDGDPYDNPWDVMSNSWGYALRDSTYGVLGKGTIGHHANILGWISSSQRLDVDSEGIYTAKVDNLELQSTSNLRLITVQIPDSNMHYTVEVRDLVGYDEKLPGFAVVIHEVDPGRKEDAWLVDTEDPANGADGGAMWLSGECFVDEPNEIEICVQSVTSEGFVVRIAYGDTGLVFPDGFESGGTGAWSSTIP
jgi:M6 family metalloprotease-like protein